MRDALSQEIVPGQFCTYPFHGSGRSIVVKVGIVIKTTEKRVVVRRHGDLKNTTVNFPERLTVVDPPTVPREIADALDRIYHDSRLDS